MQQVRNFLCFFVLAWSLGIAIPSAAKAASVEVRRHVTLRADHQRHSTALRYPEIGEVFELLDDSRRTQGYYHVQLPDGRSGWLYSTFVRRLDNPVAFTSTDAAIAHFIDVDQGSAALLEFPCGAVLIDAGGRDVAAGDHLISYLEGFFARRPDLNRHLAAVFVTHTHVDHNRTLKRVAETFIVDGYIHNGLLNGSGRANAAWMVEYGPSHSPPIGIVIADEAAIAAGGLEGLSNSIIDPLSCPRVDPDFRVMSGSYRDNPGWPDGEFDNGNNQSLVVKVTYGKAKLLFTGDLEEPAIETLLARYANGDALDADVYVVGHHGSANGTTAALLAAVSPQIAIMSMGNSATHAQWTAWAYGHPRRAIVTLLDNATSGKLASPEHVMVADRVKRFSDYTLKGAVYGTGWNGDIDVTVRPDGIIMTTTSR